MKRASFSSQTFVILCVIVYSTVSVLATVPTDPERKDGALSVMDNSSATLPADCSTSWWATVQKNIRQSEYHITWQKKTCLKEINAAWQAPNRAQNLRTYFTPAGIRVIFRDSKKVDWQWGVEVSGYGYSDNVKSIKSGKIKVKENRIEYVRDKFIEWYVNSEKGLEQGFTLHMPSEGGKTKSSSTIVLHMKITGTLFGCSNSKGNEIVFKTDKDEDIIHYGSLYAKDAVGKELSCQMSLDKNQLQLCIDTAEAVYPITIDPMITGGLSITGDWLAESDQVSAEFGVSVATAGDVNGDGYSDIIVGARYYDNGQTNEGRTYVFHGSASGLSTAPDWTAESDQDYAYFGSSISTAGDVNNNGYSDVIIGAQSYSNGQLHEGRVYVYHGSSTGLSTTADWIAESDLVDTFFGCSVSTAGDINADGYSDIIIGANGYDIGADDGGAVYVYHGSASGLSTTADWTAESGQEYAYFGDSVSTAGDVNGDGYCDVIVGAYSYTNDQTDEGAAFVWHGSTSGLGDNGTPANADWTAEGNQNFSSYGESVSTAGDVNGDGYSDVIIGASSYDNGQNEEGRTFVYHGSASGLSTTADWTAESDLANAYFGISVATAGDVNGDGYADVTVGAITYTNGHPDEGAAFVWHGSATGLGANGTPANADWAVESNQGEAYFGISVSTAGDVNGDGYSDVIVGAYQYTNGQSDEGAAFVYHGSAAGLEEIYSMNMESDQANAILGHSVSTAGDVNGDGYADVIIGIPGYDGGQTDEGQVYVYHGSATGLSVVPDWTAESDQAGAELGHSVSNAGDVNGDGFSDVIIGASGYDNDQTDEGRAFVYHGSDFGLSITPDWTAEADQADASFGYSVSTAGDVNGDGYADVIIGANNYGNGQYLEGAAFVYHGSSSGLFITEDWKVESDKTYAEFGYSVSTAGDVNGDGYSDVIIGAYGYENGQIFEGAAFVYHGSSSGLSTTSNWSIESDQAYAFLGISVSTAGDVNGDGYSDVIVGAHSYTNSQSNEGGAFAYHGSASGLSTSADWTAESDQEGAELGRSVSHAGDVNGDGYSDIIIGARAYDNGQPNIGAAFVWHGSASGLGVNGTPANADWTAESDQGNSLFGASISSAGDVNGDGYSDVIVGASQYSNGQTYEGKAFVYHGNGGEGVSLIPQQRMAVVPAPLAYLGKSDSSDSFRLLIQGSTPYGRGKIKLEWEVKPFGILFDGTGLGQSATWTDTGTGGMGINELVTGLSSFTPYHWRMRLKYHPTTTPYQQYSRWLTIPINGWQEADLRTACHLIADLTGDCHVTLLDLNVLCSQWLQSGTPGSCPWIADLDGNCLVNMLDFGIFSAEWEE